MAKHVRFLGPHARLEVDDKVLERNGAPVSLTEAQVRRIEDRNIEVIEEASPKARKSEEG